MYEEEVDEKALATIKPFRILPLLENDRVKEAPANIVTEFEFPLAANVFGMALPPLTVTTALEAELLMATLMLWDTVFTV